MAIFYWMCLQKQAFDALEIKNPLRIRNGFLVVDKVIEPLARRSQISNLELLKDLNKFGDSLLMNTEDL